MSTAFIIVLSIILISQLIGILSLATIRPVVIASDMSQFYHKYKLLFGKQPKFICTQGRKVNVSPYVPLYGYGNSMKDYDIFDGQVVYVSPLNEVQKDTISNYPVVVFHIHDMKWQSSYKLRKFVSYVDNPSAADWQNIYTTLHEKIKISEEDFLSEMQRKLNKLNHPTSRYILFETYDEDTLQYRYSLHPVDSLYAKAVYTAKP